jgi:hypothetical protein
MTVIPPEWLGRKGTPEEFERAALEGKAAAFNLEYEMVVQKLGARPFGHMTDSWREFVKKMARDDKLWSFSSLSEMFAKKLGCAGYAIVRAGTIRDTLIMLIT